MYPKKLEDEQTRLRHRIMRMRAMLCFAKDPRAEAGMWELIGDAEARLTALEARRPTRQ
jgi:hypothetical protein